MAKAHSLSTQDFLNYLFQSGLVESDAISHLLDQLRVELGGELPDSAGVLADRFVEAGLITRWHADKLLDRKYKGFRLGKYKLLKLLGSGGVSSVYLAEHVLMKQLRAIKVFPKSWVNRTSYLARFHSEAQATTAFDHFRHAFIHS